jgi:hypothetical protein
MSDNPITKAMRDVIAEDPDGATTLPVLITHQLCALACLWDKLDAIEKTLKSQNMLKEWYSEMYCETARHVLDEADPERSDPTTPEEGE